VGVNGTALHWDGSKWTRIETGVTVPLYGVWGNGSKNVWASGASGVLLQWDGEAWRQHNSGAAAGEALYALWVSPRGVVWLVSNTGGIYRSDR
jgi:hypothetical protein